MTATASTTVSACPKCGYSGGMLGDPPFATSTRGTPEGVALVEMFCRECGHTLLRSQTVGQ